VTSDAEPLYNCVAYAIGDTTRKWSPTVIPYPGYYWPKNARKDDHPEALKSAFETEGFEVCTSAEPEVGFVKVALYVDSDGSWSHAARQQSNGEWVSKLGDGYDVCHPNPHCFGENYGQVVYFMRKKINGEGHEGKSQ
jgi:hypothetical protein